MKTAKFTENIDLINISFYLLLESNLLTKLCITGARYEKSRNFHSLRWELT